MTGGTRALHPGKGSQWKSLNNQWRRRRGDVFAFKWLHTRQGRYEKKGKGSRRWRNTPLLRFNSLVLQLWPTMVACCLMWLKALVRKTIASGRWVWQISQERTEREKPWERWQGASRVCAHVDVLFTSSVCATKCATSTVFLSSCEMWGTEQKKTTSCPMKWRLELIFD